MIADAIGAGSACRVRVEGADWEAVAAELDDLGCALLPPLLTAADARHLIKLYDRDEAFRSTVTMERHQLRRGRVPLPGRAPPRAGRRAAPRAIPTPAAGGPRVVHQARTTHALA